MTLMVMILWLFIILFYDSNFISSPKLKLNRLRITYVNKYNSGVSRAATTTLKRNPLNSNPPKSAQSNFPKVLNKNNTVNVSINCEVKVEKLLRTHSILPLVSRFQKWNNWISIYCANRYAIIEAKTAIPVAPKTLVNSPSSIGDQSVAGT